MQKIDIYNQLKKFVVCPENINEFEMARDLLDRLQNGAFISYAQNYEDIIIRRLFADKRDGFFIDVGAFDPFLKSTTFAFSKIGWQGMNIDVCKENIEKFKIHRSKDINICAAVGSGEDEKEFFVVPGTTRSTILKDLAQDYSERGMQVTSEKIATKSLTDLCDENSITKIDFISIDTEGSEESVIKSFDLERFLPTLIVVEATFPETSQPAWQPWEKHLLNANYNCAYFDGLNRFYIHKDQNHLQKHFELPPNYFDNFVRYNEVVSIASSLKRVEE